VQRCVHGQDSRRHRDTEDQHQVGISLMIVTRDSSRTTRHATGTDGTDRDLRAFDQQGLVLMLTR
jgi:hypothetical protein